MTQKKRTILNVTVTVVSALFFALGFLLIFSALWFLANFNRDVGLDSVIFTIFSDIHGADSGLINSFLLESVLPTLLCTAFLTAILALIPRLIEKKRPDLPRFPLVIRVVALCIATVFLVVSFFSAGTLIGLFEYLEMRSNSTKIFDNYYVSPDKTAIRFPEEKRNLIYIYLESVELAFMDEANGGTRPENLLPNLESLARENVNFSHTGAIGGGQTTTGSTWTIGAMVTQSAGVPLCLPSNIWINGLNYYNKVLPGLTSITDILHENGYNQALMVGSEASFGGRKEYFLQHGVDAVYDLFTARTEGILPTQDYYDGFWGFEDYYLFDYAKEKITAMANGAEPFAFTMLTVDTHHPAGHRCPNCPEANREGLSEREAQHAQFEEVLTCSDRQVSRFVEWLKAQDFYENTAVVITGDHCSMNTEYFEDYVDDGYVRRVYNCFLNSAFLPEKEKNREFTTLDMFPTTLAALGCKIEGDRLGLGTNLFSARQTLAEELGIDYLNEEILKISPYYETNFHYGSR